MRYTVKAVFTGLLLGAGFYFVPFGFPFFLFLLFIFTFFRLFLGRRRALARCSRFQRPDDPYSEIVPIDGYGMYGGGTKGTAERNIPIQ